MPAANWRFGATSAVHKPQMVDNADSVRNRQEIT